MVIQRFDCKTLVDALETLQDDCVLADIHATPLLLACRQLVELTKLLGPALYFAGEHVFSQLQKLSDVVTQANTASIRTLVDNEGSTTGDATYALMRLVWMLDFAEALLTNLLFMPPDTPLRECARAAYEDRLADKHKWFIRQAVRASLYACPTRHTLLRHMQTHHGRSEGDEDAAYHLLLCTRALLQKPVAALYTFTQSLRLKEGVVDINSL
jgi:hypothetical protein